jgi:hypothetical protein
MKIQYTQCNWYYSKKKKHDFMYILWINKEHVDFLFIHLCLRLNWLSRYVIVLLFDNIIIVVVVMIVLILFMTLLNFVVFILLFVIFESPSKQNIVTVRKIHMVNKFTVSRVKAVQVNKENDKIILIAIGNVLKNKYIHIVNNIVCEKYASMNMNVQIITKLITFYHYYIMWYIFLFVSYNIYWQYMHSPSL